MSNFPTPVHYVHIFLLDEVRKRAEVSYDVLKRSDGKFLIELRLDQS